MRDYSKRNRKIYNLYLHSEATLAEIGKIFNLTRERIRQIVEAEKLARRHTKSKLPLDNA